MTQENSQRLSADKPLQDPKDDKLGYAPFAKNLSSSICDMTPPEGFVLAVYAPWGSGKSTMLNFVRYYLEQRDEAERPVVLTFNPWWFSGHEDLLKKFFGQLRAMLGQKKDMKDVLPMLGDFADTLGDLPLGGVEKGAKLLSFLAKTQQRSITDLKKKVEDTLREKNRRILVIIDDIDRLTAEEIRQLFRLIKAVADFPNVIYLLAFDKGVAMKALESVQSGSGAEYLEKIVQVPFELPMPDRTALRSILFEKLNALLGNIPDDQFDKSRWGKIFRDGIDHYIQKPRDIVRLSNTLSVTYPAVKDEVNPVDFIAIETLRVFCPQVYDVIRKNPESFTGHLYTGSYGDHQHKDSKKFHDAWLAQVPEEEREVIKDMVIKMFPKVESTWGNIAYPGEWEAKWRKELRICSEERFSAYFRLAIPEGAISNTEMKGILSLTDDSTAFSARLVELSGQKRPDGTTRVKAALDLMADYSKDIEIDRIPKIVEALFSVGDSLIKPEDENIGNFDFGNEHLIGRVIWQLLPRLEEQKRFDVLKKSIEASSSLTLIVEKVFLLGQQHGKEDGTAEPENKRYVTAQHLTELEQIGLKKIQDAAKNGTLLNAKLLDFTLYRWKQWGDEEGMKKWIQEQVATDAGLAAFLEKKLHKYIRYGEGGEKVIPRLNPNDLKPFIDPESLIDRCRAMSTSDSYQGDQKTAINQFVKEYDMIKQGKNSDNRLNFGFDDDE